MDRLIAGIRTFKTREIEAHPDFWQELASGQAPHTLFITCCDSRVVPSLLTNTRPGELFVVRNIANIVPFWRESDEFFATTSTIEYSVKVLKVRDIVVCGHSDCGGCAAFYKDEATLATIPHTRKWMELARPVVEAIRHDDALMKDPARRAHETELRNVALQVDHLLTYPYIREAMAAGELEVSGWHWDLASGTVLVLDRETGRFKPVTRG